MIEMRRELQPDQIERDEYDMLTSKAARFLDLSSQHVRTLTNQGKIPFIARGGYRWYRKADLIAYLELKKAAKERTTIEVA